MISIVHVDDELLFLNGLKTLINMQSDVQILRTFSSARDFKAEWPWLAPRTDIILMDMNIPEENGVNLTHFALQQWPKTKIIGLSSHYSRTLIFKMIEVGSSSYLQKNIEFNTLLQTIKRVNDSGMYYEDLKFKLPEHTRNNKTNREKLLYEGLSEREIEILGLICKQYTTYEIGDKLFISTKTVERHRSNLFEKTKSKNVVGLVHFALKHNLIEPDFYTH